MQNVVAPSSSFYAEIRVLRVLSGSMIRPNLYNIDDAIVLILNRLSSPSPASVEDCGCIEARL